MRSCFTALLTAASLLIFAPLGSAGPRCIPDQTACCPDGYVVTEHADSAMTCSPEADARFSVRTSIPI
ncbi:Uncharacterised protein [Mycobacteroides abscessus subsp. abscessus]|nr:Uncharacterised protein [Mycobacteroides abscessus subsp. abscessus]SIC72658.1 Uncharacterised protein [Mycobacteroides abscessus subsp. abscessus]SKP79919.1 Uncharacterised protein [Mycobacteroides abscessus subsp. abscessus]